MQKCPLKTFKLNIGAPITALIALITSAMFITSPALAETTNSINLKMVTQQFFSQFENRLLLNSKDSSCSLNIITNGDLISYEFSNGTSKTRKFINPVTFSKAQVLFQPEGKSKDEGYYAYSQFHIGAQTTSLIKGVYYYEPSYDPADSRQDMISEQRIQFERKGSDINVEYVERGGNKPIVIKCKF